MLKILRTVSLKNFLALFLIILACSAFFVVAVQREWMQDNLSAASAGEKAAYVCPMHPQETSDKPGSCSICGMALVKQETIKNVAILIFDGVQIIDYTGPYELFGQQHLNVYTVSEKLKPVTTSMDMSVNPSFDFSNAPEPNILLLPGGDVDPHLQNPAVIKWIQEQSRKAEHVLSVCNGAFFLAKAGLLDGLSATTFHGLIDDLKSAAPKTKIVTDQRFVDNGKIITSAGLSSGIDASIHLISKIYGMDRAKELALHLEYDWKPDSKYARANLADKYLRNFRVRDIPNTAEWQRVKNLGGLNEWEVQGTLKSSWTATELLKRFNEKLTQAKWTQTPAKASDPATTYWKFTGDHGEVWIGTLNVKPVENEPNRYTVTLCIQNSKSAASKI